MKCRFDCTRMVKYYNWENKRIEVKEIPTIGKHFFEKICSECRAKGKTKKDDLRLSVKIKK